jgi:hypothetical protein
MVASVPATDGSYTRVVAEQASFVETSECRQCCTFCDRVVLPSGCLQSGCQYLYLYDDEDTGARYMGCMNKVFKVEIDMAVFNEAQRTRHGFGGVKMTGRPLPQCRTAVERAYDGHGSPFECVNPRFFDDPAGEPASFDLRDRL